MQCKDIAQVIEQEGFSPLPEAARGHVAGCSVCSSLITDIERILAVASEIPAEVEPPSRVWVSLRAQLEAEKIITDRAMVTPTRGRMLATAAVAALIVAAGYVQMTHKPSASTGSNTAVADRVPRAVREPFADAGTSLDQEEQSLGPIRTASMSSVSPVDNSLRENLATLNTFIKECRKRLQEDPNDQVARDYLSAAYQQKAEILAAMMDRSRSVN
ncbi:MAG: hypothetical protein DMG34_20370 [Acidobacteria bacterium]|nr:MAG: hypothetical protein DMG34_20370 [Acidobacteriota bacterium]